jgi:hypothetical protein
MFDKDESRWERHIILRLAINIEYQSLLMNIRVLSAASRTLSGHVKSEYANEGLEVEILVLRFGLIIVGE